MAEQYIDKPAVVVITGTHSFGKTTLLNDIETGKLSDLGLYDYEYNDFGYGLLEAENGTHPFITVPESARRLADLFHRLDLLTDSYSLDFQLEIESSALFRIIAATNMAKELSRELVGDGVIEPSQSVISPIVIPDRGPLDGIVYSKLRIPDENMDAVNGSPRTGFWSEWLKESVDLVVITDYRDVPFEPDEARLEDIKFRELVAESIESSYRQFLDESSVTVINGNRAERRIKLLALLGQTGNYGDIVRKVEPYARWGSIILDIPTT